MRVKQIGFINANSINLICVVRFALPRKIAMSLLIVILKEIGTYVNSFDKTTQISNIHSKIFLKRTILARR